MLILLAILFPAVSGILVSALCADRGRWYAGISAGTALLAAAAVLWSAPVTLVTFSENVTFSFAFDSLGRIFAVLTVLLYTATAFYAFEYMRGEANQPVFFAFFYVSLGAMIAVCAASNLVTVYFCFELATLSTVPLVLHEGTKEATAAGLKYLFYSIAGALMGLFGVFFVYYYGAGGREFVFGGFLDAAAVSGREGLLLAAVFTAIVGFGTKAGMYPMHGWLPSAHPIAPAPASALLSGIIAKAGVIAVIRLVYYSVGADFLRGTWVQYAWMALAMLTVLMGSMMAFLEKNLKKRLAYSTISQISYAMLALSLLSDAGLRGGLLQVMSHVASKGCLFLCAGVFICRLGKHGTDELAGVGRQMPVTLWCFTIASLSLIGIPPLGGFLSKWVIALAAADDGMGALSVLPSVVLLISALLTAGYLLPIAFRGFFPGRDFEGPAEKSEPGALMTVPMLALCCAALAVGVYGVTILNALGF